jgi:heat shock protein HspQ
LKYIHWTGSAWVTEIVDSNADGGYSASLVLDSADRPRISYYGNKGLKYASYDGSRWITETVDSLGNVGTYASLALDRGDRPRMAYYDLTNGDLKFAWQTKVDVVPAIGGTFGAFGSATFDLPAGAVTDTVVLTYTVLQPSASLPHVGVFFDISAVYASTGQIAQIAPGKTYTVVVNYDEANVPAYVNESSLALYYWDSSSSQWVKEPTSMVDTMNNTITATPNHFSVWAALGESRRIYLPVVLRND